MTAGKLLHSFSEHKGPITSVTFHPTEFLMATSSADGLVKVFDLQTFETITTSALLEYPPKKIIFSGDGQELYVGTDVSLEIMSWEPFSSIDSIPVNWNHLSDFRYDSKDENILGVTRDQNLIGLWMLNMVINLLLSS